MQDVPGAARDESQIVDVDFEAPSPRQVEQLRRSGVHLPHVSRTTADPRSHSDFIEQRVTAVGYGLTAGGYLLYCEGLQFPVLVPEAQVDLGLMRAMPLNASIYPDRDTALVDLKERAAEAGVLRYAYYRGAGGSLVVPTLFSPATTPRIARTMFEVRAHLAQSTERELKVLLLTLSGTKVLQGVFSRVLRVGRSRTCGHPPRERTLGVRHRRHDSRTCVPPRPPQNLFLRRAHLRHHPGWSRPSAAPTRRRRCRLAPAYLRTSQSDPHRPGSSRPNALSALAQPRTRSSKQTSGICGTWVLQIFG